MADAVLVSTLCLVAALCSALASFFPGEPQAIAQVNLKTTFHSYSLQSIRSIWEKWSKEQEEAAF